jgi:hypothetical protein
MQVVANDMEQDAQIVMRVPQVMADQLKEYATNLSRDFGVPVSLAAAVRRLLAEGLERAGMASSPTEAPEEPPTRKRPAKRKVSR